MLHCGTGILRGLHSLRSRLCSAAIAWRAPDAGKRAREEGEWCAAPRTNNRFSYSWAGPKRALRLLHSGNDEFRALPGAGRPTRCDRLGLGIETDRVRPVLIEIAEARTFPAAEGVIGERNRDGKIHADHPDFHPAGKIAGGVAIAGKDRDAVAVFMFGREPYGFFIILGAHHRKYGTEYLFFVDAHIRRYLVEQAAAHEEAVFITLQFESAAIDLELGAFVYTEIDVALDLFQMRPCDQRSVVGLRVARGADAEAFHARNELFKQPVSSLLADRHCHRYRHAALASRPIAGAD